MDSIREFFYFSMSTSTASLACVCRVDFYQSPIGAFSLIRIDILYLNTLFVNRFFRKDGQFIPNQTEFGLGSSCLLRINTKKVKFILFLIILYL